MEQTLPDAPASEIILALLPEVKEGMPTIRLI